jgi:hypothetical protein
MGFSLAVKRMICLFLIDIQEVLDVILPVTVMTLVSTRLRTNGFTDSLGYLGGIQIPLVTLRVETFKNFRGCAIRI